MRFSEGDDEPLGAADVGEPVHVLVVHFAISSAWWEASRLQYQLVTLVRILNHFPFHSAVKCILTRQDIPAGPCRLPQAAISAVQADRLFGELAEADLDHWLFSSPPSSGAPA